MATDFTANRKVELRIKRLAEIARNSAQYPITTKRMTGTGDNRTMVDNTDPVGNEAIILSALLRTYLNPSDLGDSG